MTRLRQSRPLGVSVIALCGVAVAVLTAGGPASEAVGATTSTTAQFTGTVPLAVSSVTVSPGSGTFGNCSGGTGGTTNTLALPNGTCTTTVNVNESGGSAYIYAAASNASASDGGTGWSLCVPNSKVSTPTCSSGALPGTDQFALKGVFPGGAGWLGSASACLPGPPAACTSLSNTAQPAQLTLYGPTKSSDDASSFSVTVTFTVVPG